MTHMVSVCATLWCVTMQRTVQEKQEKPLIVIRLQHSVSGAAQSQEKVQWRVNACCFVGLTVLCCDMPLT